MLKCRAKFFMLLICLCFIFLIGRGFYVYSNNFDPSKIRANVEFLNKISGGNKFIFSVNVENNTEGTIKDFFISESDKNYSVDTYEISENKYVIVVTKGDKSFNISNVKLGVTLVINRTEQKVEGIGVLNGKNENFKSGQVVSEPMLLYHNQDKITLAIQIDDPWDTLKNIQSILVYPEFGKDVDVSYEKKYVVLSGNLKQFVYVSMKSFKSNEALKFNINLLFQQGIDNVSLKGITKVFLYNFDDEVIAKQFIKNVYTNLLGRQPTDLELNKSSKNFINDHDYNLNFILDILKSNEFKNIKITDEEFLNRIYKIILNRMPDQEGKNYWLDEIKKSSRLEVVQRIVKG